jgi:DNA helicase HerA-like ATPase
MDKKIMECELEFLSRFFMKRNSCEFVFAIEEVHLLESKNALSCLDDMSFAGRHRGINPCWITQRPQSLPRACITQTTQIIMFNMNFEDSWLKNYGLNADQLREQIQGQKYKYCRWTPQTGLENANILTI